jgi:hypothetical protein
LIEIPFEEFAFNYFIPFILFFSVVYVLLTQLKIFGEPTSALARKISLIVSLGLGVLVIFVNPFEINFKLFLSQLSSVTMVIVFGLIFFVFFVAMLSFAAGVERTNWIVLVASIGLIILAFSTTGILKFFPLPTTTFPSLDFGVVGAIIILVIIFVIVRWLFKG